jgi:glutathione S-transferase
MKLYYMPGACSLAPHIALLEAALPFELEKVGRDKKTESGGDYLNVNPKGAVPALKLDNGEVLTEAGVIQQYVADKVPPKKLVPAAGTSERYRLQEWLNYIASEVHKGIGQLFNPAMPEAYKAAVKNGLGQRQLPFIEKALATKDYLLGQFSVADGYLFTVLRWTSAHNVDLSGYPNISAFMKRMAERPAVQEAMKVEGLLNA